ncbi:hypothetical protein Taro_043203 [Colocasia esculenta]|uniref:Uncharacterized protein n=1 Tax=Colocasia esculenta TaxID=4460 RepID=A0A843WV20_COLES|nr:hypothetical protein [Colocasia esculenta]
MIGSGKGSPAGCPKDLILRHEVADGRRSWFHLEHLEVDVPRVPRRGVVVADRDSRHLVTVLPDEQHNVGRGGGRSRVAEEHGVGVRQLMAADRLVSQCSQTPADRHHRVVLRFMRCPLADHRHCPNARTQCGVDEVDHGLQRGGAVLGHPRRGPGFAQLERLPQKRLFPGIGLQGEAGQYLREVLGGEGHGVGECAWSEGGCGSGPTEVKLHLGAAVEILLEEGDDGIWVSKDLSLGGRRSVERRNGQSSV